MIVLAFTRGDLRREKCDNDIKSKEVASEEEGSNFV